MSEPQTTDSTTDVMRYWVGLLRQLGEDVCTWMAVVEALKAQAERDRAVIEAARQIERNCDSPSQASRDAWELAYEDLLDAIRLHDEATP